MTAEELSRAVAEIVGDDGFEAAEWCPGNHHNIDEDLEHPIGPVGRICINCVGGAVSAAMDSEGDPVPDGGTQAYAERLRRFWDRHLDFTKRAEEHPEEHPEWRIGRGKPKPYAEDPSLMIPVVQAWCVRHHAGWGVGWSEVDGFQATVFAYAAYGNYIERVENELGAMASLADAWLTAVGHEGS